MFFTIVCFNASRICSNLSENYYFVPVGIETFGAYGPQAIKLIKQIGKKNTGSYRGKIVHFLSHAKYLSQWQYKKEMRSVLGVVQKNIISLRGPLQLSCSRSRNAVIKLV